MYPTLALVMFPTGKVVWRFAIGALDHDIPRFKRPLLSEVVSFVGASLTDQIRTSLEGKHNPWFVDDRLMN